MTYLGPQTFGFDFDGTVFRVLLQYRVHLLAHLSLLVLHHHHEVEESFEFHFHYVVGVGGTEVRKRLVQAPREPLFVEESFQGATERVISGTCTYP